ncbi:MAG: transglycosylase SLT domain-containing protein [Pseudomonadota bacterium]|nr:transglycosylase SLT domain-containing protein [Pseudomonadota bacterium]
MEIATAWVSNDNLQPMSAHPRRHACFSPLGWVSVALMCAFGLTYAGSRVDELSGEREGFRRAREALRAGDLQAYRQLASGLEDYALYPYLRYDYLRPRLAQAAPHEVRTFLKAYSETLLAAPLRTAWLRTLALRGDWPIYMEFYTYQEDPVLRCHYATARLRLGPDNAVLEEIKQLWLSAATRPTECDPAFAALQERSLDEDLIWRRIRLAMTAGETRLAAYLGDRLSRAERPWATLWITSHNDPAKVLAGEDFKHDHPIGREIIAHGIARLARTDAEQAYAVWRRFAPRFKSGDPLIGQIERSLGLAAADQRLPQAFAWLHSIDAGVVDAQVQRAQLRLAIATGAWSDLARWTKREAVGDMNPLRWRYWRARALESTGHAPAARGLFQELAAERDYYGFAAADRLGVRYRFGHRPTRLAATEDARIRSLPGMARARELWLAGYLREARSEWTYTVNHLPDRAVPAAAAIAHEWGWHDRVISALGKVKAYDDLDLRFPIPYASWVSESAARYNMEPAILYSIMRAESAFFDQARSTAGAVGLMQVLPSTGRQVAKDLGMPLAADVKLYDPKTNIALGSRYLHQMLARFNGHLAMAAAAYNAGPGKVERWRPQGGCQNAEFWVETIPYRETRRYVRNTLFYTALYEWRMGKQVKPISERLAAVSPRGGTATMRITCAAANEGNYG